MLHRHKFAPESDRIRDDKIRLDLPDLLRGHLIEGQRRGDEEFCCESLVLAYPVCVLLIFHLEIIAVAANKCRARLLDLLPEHLKREVVDLMPGGCQFLYNAERRIGMPVGRDTEPCNLHFTSTSLYATLKPLALSKQHLCRFL